MSQFIQKLLAISCFHAQDDSQCKELCRENIEFKEKHNAVKGPEKAVKEKLCVTKESKASLEAEVRQVTKESKTKSSIDWLRARIDVFHKF